MSDAIDTHPRLARLIRDTLGWRRVDDGLLISATVLIALSVLGFQVAIRVWLDRLYVMPPGAASFGSVALGLALLGGGGDLRFGFYPYDLPHTFVFALGLLAIHARSLWLLPVFALATYSKETAILLIPAYLLVADRWSSRHTLGMTVALLAIFVVIRLVLDRQYGRGIGGFWFPGRNARWLAWYLAFDAWWYWPVVIVAILRLGRQAALYPRELRRLSVLVVPLLGLAFFKGWIEEKRQYLEMLPILGPLSLQWVAIELGWGESFVARTRSEPPISDHLPGQPRERPRDGNAA
ncbi:MAG: hypothetical protein U0794_20640 [Isosphaeraceae bacterium]